MSISATVTSSCWAVALFAATMQNANAGKHNEKNRFLVKLIVIMGSVKDNVLYARACQ
jgi:hypothetical protein